MKGFIKDKIFKVIKKILSERKERKTVSLFNIILVALPNNLNYADIYGYEVYGENKVVYNIIVIFAISLFIMAIVVLSLDFESKQMDLKSRTLMEKFTYLKGDEALVEDSDFLAIKKFKNFLVALRKGNYYILGDYFSYKIKIIGLSAVLTLVGFYKYSTLFGPIELFENSISINFTLNMCNIVIGGFIWVCVLIFMVFNTRGAGYIGVRELLIFWTIKWMAFFAICSNDLFSLIILIESITFCLYILASLLDENKNKTNLAAIYYARYGLLASTLFVFGCALLYSQTGHWKLSENFLVLQFMLCTLLNYTEQTERFFELGVEELIIYIGTIMILVNFLFKFSAVPVQYWIVEVYTSVRFEILCFFVLFTKQIFLLLFVLKFYSIIMICNPIAQILIVAGILSVIYGLTGALFNNGIKSFTAYSSIASSGIIIICLSFKDMDLVIVSLVYFVLYTLLVFIILANLMLLGKSTSRGTGLIDFFSEISKYKETDPYILFVNKVLLFVLTGIPIFIFFITKVYIYLLLLINKDIYIFVFIFIAFAIMIGYYLRIIKDNIGVEGLNDKTYSFTSSLYEIKNLARKYSITVLMINSASLLLILGTPLFINTYIIVAQLIMAGLK